jgi:hypothetical protein
MKKSYLMIAAAAALLTACAGNDTIHDVEEPESAITFNQALNKTTRAYIADEAGLAGEGGFIVYGYKRKTSESGWTAAQTIFNGVNVKSTNSGTSWSYDNLRFWDKNGTYNFFAIAPYNPTTGTYSLVANSAPEALKFKIEGAASAISTASDDYLIDRDGAKNVDGAYTGTTHPVVNIDFHHIMAKIDFKLKSTLSSGKITVTKLTMTGWNSGAGTFTQSLTATPTTLVNSEWAIPTAGTGNITLVGTGASQNSVELTCATEASPTAVTDWYIMVPQNIAASTLTFTVDYTFKDGEYSETFEDQVATLTAAQVWGTDSHTTYTLDIKPAAIEFDVTSICGFCVDGGQADPIVVQ